MDLKKPLKCKYLLSKAPHGHQIKYKAFFKTPKIIYWKQFLISKMRAQ